MHEDLVEHDIALTAGLRLPIIVAPMFLVSTSNMVVEAAKSRIIGTYLAPNARTIKVFDQALQEIVEGLPSPNSAWAISLIVHSTYDRFDAELEIVCRYRPPLVITALGNPGRVSEPVHKYGGVVFCDVANTAQARRAADAGVDGLILLTSGAGGHTGNLSAFAFIEEVREFWSGPLVLAGAIGTGHAVRAAIELGVDFVYMGTRFLACEESMASRDYRNMVVESGLENIITSSAPTGLPANWFKESLEAAGFTDEAQKSKEKADFSTLRDDVKAWKTIWSAGQSVGRTKSLEPLAAIVDQLDVEFRQPRARKWLDH